MEPDELNDCAVQILGWPQRRRVQQAVQRGLPPCADEDLGEAIDRAVDRALMQEAFESCGHMRCWVVRTARNIVIDRFRRRGCVRQLADEDQLPDTEDRLTRALNRLLGQVIPELSEEDREFLRLHWLEGWTYEQLAGRYGTATVTQWRRMRRLQADLRRRLLGMNCDPFDEDDPGDTE